MAAQPREGALAGEPAAAIPGPEWKGKQWRGRAPSGAARHGRWGGRSAGLGNTGAAGAGWQRAGEGLGRGAFSSPPRSVSVFYPLAPSPTLPTPFFLFLFLQPTPVSPPRRSGRRNQQRTAKTEEEALAAAAAASNMAETSRAAQLGDRRRQPARPLATGPRGPAAARKPSSERRPERRRPEAPLLWPGAAGSSAPSPLPADAGASAAAGSSVLGGHCRALREENNQTILQSHKFRKEFFPRFCCFHADWPLYTSGWV